MRIRVHRMRESNGQAECFICTTVYADCVSLRFNL
jgi:hypothetical protein